MMGEKRDLQPCEDTVSRKELLKIFEDKFWELQRLQHIKENKCAKDIQLGVNYCINTLKELSSVTPQGPRWIPCSERMPKHTGYYLVQYSRKICHDEMAVAYYSVEEKQSDPDYEWEFHPMCGEYEEVIAWRPLPKPYEPQERSE